MANSKKTVERQTLFFTMSFWEGDQAGAGDSCRDGRGRVSPELWVPRTSLSRSLIERCPVEAALPLRFPESCRRRLTQSFRPADADPSTRQAAFKGEGKLLRPRAGGRKFTVTVAQRLPWSGCQRSSRERRSRGRRAPGRGGRREPARPAWRSPWPHEAGSP